MHPVGPRSRVPHAIEGHPQGVGSLALRNTAALRPGRLLLPSWRQGRAHRLRRVRNLAAAHHLPLEHPARRLERWRTTQHRTLGLRGSLRAPRVWLHTYRCIIINRLGIHQRRSFGPRLVGCGRRPRRRLCRRRREPRRPRGHPLPPLRAAVPSLPTGLAGAAAWHSGGRGTDRCAAAVPLDCVASQRGDPLFVPVLASGTSSNLLACLPLALPDRRRPTAHSSGVASVSALTRMFGRKARRPSPLRACRWFRRFRRRGDLVQDIEVSRVLPRRSCADTPRRSPGPQGKGPRRAGRCGSMHRSGHGGAA